MLIRIREGGGAKRGTKRVEVKLRECPTENEIDLEGKVRGRGGGD